MEDFDPWILPTKILTDLQSSILRLILDNNHLKMLPRIVQSSNCIEQPSNYLFLVLHRNEYRDVRWIPIFSGLLGSKPVLLVTPDAHHDYRSRIGEVSQKNYC